MSVMYWLLFIEHDTSSYFLIGGYESMACFPTMKWLSTELCGGCRVSLSEKVGMHAVRGTMHAMG